MIKLRKEDETMLKNMIILGNTNFMDVEYSEGNINLTKKRSAFKTY